MQYLKGLVQIIISRIFVAMSRDDRLVLYKNPRLSKVWKPAIGARFADEQVNSSLTCTRSPNIKPILDFASFVILSQFIALLQKVIEGALANNVRVLFQSMVMVTSLLDI